MKDLLLVTDLDHTLVGDRHALARLNHTLRTLRSRIHLVYATGRSLAGARQLQQEEDLLEPEGWATGVGSALLWCGKPDLAWDRQLQRHWDRPALSALLSGWSGLILQPASEQTPYKLSYELVKPRVGTEEAHQFEQHLRATLRQADLQAQVVFSSGHQLDLLPPRCGQGCSERLSPAEAGSATRSSALLRRFRQRPFHAGWSVVGGDGEQCQAGTSGLVEARPASHPAALPPPPCRGHSPCPDHLASAGGTLC